MASTSSDIAHKLKVLFQKSSKFESAINKNCIAFVSWSGAKSLVPKGLKVIGLDHLAPFVSQTLERAIKEDGHDQSFLNVQLATGPDSQIRIIFVPKVYTAFDRDEFLRKNLGECFVAERDRLEVWVTQFGLSEKLNDEMFERVVLLAELSVWAEPSFKKEPKKLPDLEVHLLVGTKQKTIEALAHRAQKTGQAINRVRSLADMPANKLNPSQYRSKIEALCKDHKLKVETWDRKKLASLGAGSFLAVVQGEVSSDAAIVKISYSGRGSKKDSKKLALVGKGLCFDTGGHNLKTSHMFGMHRDMTGSAVALALVILCAELDLPIKVDAYLAIAENYLSPTAYKCNEVVKAANGTTIEVVDTDAEGRMVLADTLHFASQDSPDLLLDFATLTGSVMRALDTRRSGVYGRDLKLSQKAVMIGEACGERLWNFPIEGDYKKELKSDIADILQCREKPNADHIYAATFLAHFVKKDVPWLHVDLAASSNGGGLGLVASETTGFGVQWALSMIVNHLAIKV